MMECKKALQETGGDEEAALRQLRKAGKKIMAMRQDRSTEDGRLAAYAIDQAAGRRDDRAASASRPRWPSNDEFMQLANDLAKQLATGPGAKTPDELWKQPAPSKKGKTLGQRKDDLREQDARGVPADRGFIASTRPAAATSTTTARAACCSEVEGGNDDVAKDVAMHIAAMKPEVGHDGRARSRRWSKKEREILTEQARKEGKPENIIDKMIEGRMRNFYAEHVLSEQPFVKDDKQTVGKIAEAGGMKLKKFVRWQLGEANPPAAE